MQGVQAQFKSTSPACAVYAASITRRAIGTKSFMAKKFWILFLVCSLFGRRSKELPAASTAAAATIVPESPRSQPSFEAERAQYAEDYALLTAERAKQQASTYNCFAGPRTC